MREPAPDYASRQYDRPNQAWVCGLACDGRACPAGPTAHGKCPALAECAPVRDGDRWTCNRSVLRGGECADGPTPDGACGCVHRCKPVRSLRSIRGRFVAACALLIAGGLTVLLSGSWRERVISPGPLTNAHGQLMAHETGCSACHAAGERSVAGWSLSLAGMHGGGPNQSARCMECHSTVISEAHSLAAHSVDPGLLNAIAETTEPSPNPSQHGTGIGSGVYACATCHREHQGTHFNIAAMNNGACQSCHQARYQSFATDHPDLGKWPYERRTRIAFNHASHQAKHFSEAKQAFDCRTCHLEDATGAVQLTASYEKACASCHDEKITTSVAKGVAMFALPTLDVEALQGAGHDIGNWPEGATGDFDGRLPPAMKLLLASDPEAAKAIELLGADFELMDVDPDDPEQLAACATLAKTIRELLADICERGPVAIRERLAVTLGDGNRVPATELIAGLTEQTMQGAAAWLDIADRGAVWPRGPLGSGAMDDTRLHFDPAGAWALDESSLTVRYQPQAHADPVLATWLDVLARSPNLESRPIALAMFKELSKATAAGTCASCHSIEHGSDGQMIVNWRATDRNARMRTLTKFSHGPHVILPQLADCTSCHAIDGTVDTSKSYATYDPHAFVSEFTTMSKQQCASCHTAKLAGDSCQKCHNYHVDVVEHWRRGSRRGAEVADVRNTHRR